MITNSFIKSLIENINCEQFPIKIDLVLDGGAFNGVYMLGALLYLKELEKQGKIIVDRVSGCSIGAFCGLLYSIDKLDLFFLFTKLSMQSLRTYQDFKELMVKSKKILDQHIKDGDVEKINDKYFLNYYDTKKGEQVLRSKYDNKSDLINSVFKSMYLPYIIERKMRDEDGNIDGVYPYIFTDRSKDKKILFINLITMDKLFKVMCIKNEENFIPRVIEGVMDIHKFFRDGYNTRMCNFVDKWNILDIFFFRMREIISTIILYSFYLLFKFDFLLPKHIKKNKMIKKLLRMAKQLWNDIILYLAF